LINETGSIGLKEAMLFEIELTPEQEAQAQQIEDILKAKMTVELRFISRLLASKKNRELLGATEFQVRDAVHRIGAGGIDAALEERKKGGTKDPASAARIAGKTPALWSTARRRSSV
jgi:hypothetical protein